MKKMMTKKMLFCYIPMLTLVLFFLPVSTHAYDSVQNWTGCLLDSDYSDNNPTTWDLGYRFNFSSNDSSHKFYLYRSVLVNGDESNVIKLYNFSTDSLLASASVSSNNATFSAYGGGDGFLLVNGESYRLQAYKASSKNMKECTPGAPIYPKSGDGSLITIFGLCGDNSDGTGCNDELAEGTTKIVSMKTMIIRALPLSTPSISMILKDKNLQVLNLSFIDESEGFYVMANYSNSGVPLLNGVCNFTGYNITSHFSLSNTSNMTIADNEQISVIMTEGTTNVINDYLSFRVCKNSPTSTVHVLLNDNHVINISTLSIPTCGFGFHEENNFTTSVIAGSTVNMTLVCSGCILGQSVTFIPNAEGDIAHLERQFLNHTEVLYYNSTTKFYEYKTHLYEYLTSGINKGNITVRCNSTISNNFFNVTNANLSINIISIDEVAFVNDTVVESSDGTDILIDVFDDVISSLQFNVTYSNGTVIKSVSTEVISLNQSELNVIGTYNISIRAVDDEGVVSLNRGSFLINDSVNPIIEWITPNVDNTSVAGVNDTYIIRINTSDVNLFAFQLYVRNPNGNLILDYNITDLNNSFYQIVNSINLSLTGVYILNLTVVDDHTENLISDYQIEKVMGDNELIFKFEKMIDRELIYDNVSVKYVGDYDVSEVSAVKDVDRYNFNYKFHLDADKFAKEVTHTFRIQCHDIRLRANSKYTAHLVCYDSLNWVDFENENVIDWSAKRISADEYEIKLIMNPIEDIEFKSIGGLNSVNQVVRLTSVETPPSSSSTMLDFQLDSTANVMILLVLVILFLGCYFIGFTFKNFAFSSMGFFVGLVLGFMLLNFAFVLTMIFWFLNGGMLLYTAKYSN